MAGPDEPIAAVRVAPAETAPPAGASPAAAADGVIASSAAAAVAPAALEPAAVAPAVAKPAPIELVAERPSLLETVGKDKTAEPKPDAAVEKPAADAKPAEPAKPEAAKAEDNKKAEPLDAKPAEPVYPAPLAAIEYKYTLPETLKLDDALKTEMHAAFDAFRANPAEGVQGLIDLHNKVVTDLATQSATDTLRNQHKSFNDTRTQWNKDWAADEQIGGAGYQTSIRAIARMRDQFVSAELPGTPKHEADRKSFEEFLRVTGAGDHPAFGRFLHNVARAFDEPALPPANPKPAPNNGAKPGSRRERMYDHPSSSKPL